MNVLQVAKILETAKCKEFEGLKCFIVSLEQFGEINDQMEGTYYSSDLLTKKYNLENFELRLSSAEEGQYFLCTEAQPVLDGLWAKKFKEGK